MPQRAENAYRIWQQADAEARAAEEQLKRAWRSYDETGEPPSAELMAEVSRLRSISNDRLTAAMIAMRGAPDETKP